MVYPSPLISRARSPTLCQDCGKMIKKGDQYYRRGHDFTTYCLDCYDARHKKWRQGVDGFEELKVNIINDLMSSDRSPKELNEKYGTQYNAAIRRLQMGGYPIIKERDNSRRDITISLSRETIRCISCSTSFVHIPMLTSFPAFICEECRARINDYPESLDCLLSRRIRSFFPKGLTDDLIFSNEWIKAIVSPNETLVDWGMLNVEDVSSTQTKEQSIDLSRLLPHSFIHLAGKGLLNNQIDPVGIAGLIMLGVTRARKLEFTNSQKRLLDLVHQIIEEEKLIWVPCGDQECYYCEETIYLVKPNKSKMATLSDFCNNGETNREI